MTLEMRELRGDDLFALLSIVGKLDIKDDFMALFERNAATNVAPMDKQKKEPTKAEKAKKEAEASRRGMEAMANLMQTTLKNITVVKGDINALLADLTGTSLKHIQELGLKDYTALLVGFFKKPELADFFSSIASLL